MARVDLQHRLAVRHLLPAGFQDLAHLQAQVLLADGQHRRRIGQAVRHAHLGHFVTQDRLEPLDQALLVLCCRFLCLLVRIGFQCAQVEIATGDVDEALAVEIGQVAHQPLVDAVGQQQHFHTLLAEHFQVRAVAYLAVALAGEVVDLVLAFGHAADVIGQRHALRIAVAAGGGEAQQAGHLLAVVVVLGRALLQHLAELLPERGVLLGLVGGQLLQHVQRTLGQRRFHRIDDRAGLQDLARHVQRQVVGIDHALDEAQVQRQELLGLVHHEHALHVQFQALGRIAVVQVERRAAGHVQQ
ncbi:hypothetical protein PAERUG_E15_London_28_01_14_09335 [Pseudomonas aeruginosa]|nr:hypothetical protein PAERUG_E15_London_28_01_14_09335 [Pseudomonas aeruginosa]